MINKAYENYKENSIFTARPEELTLMLYNALVRFIMQAQFEIENKNIEKANNSIIKAEDIVMELRVTLDMRYEISRSLEMLYDYMYRRLMEANLKKDREILNEVLGFAKELRDTWAQAMKIYRQQLHAKQVAK